MSSFIDLMGSVVWSENDILNRVRSERRAVVSEDRERELQNIFLGHLSGMRTANPSELAEIAQMKELQEQGGARADAARADNALLAATLQHEAALRMLALEPLEGDALDADARAAAQAVVDGASPEVLALYALRNPAQESQP